MFMGRAEKPVSVPGAFPTTGGVPMLVHLFDAGSYDPDGEIVMWEWNFGDQEEGQGGWHDHTSTRGDAWHRYEHPGTIVAHLRVTDNDGNKDVAWVKLTLSAEGNANPVAVASASPTFGTAPLVVLFFAEGSYDPDGDIVKWEWDFGDGVFIDCTDTEGLTEYTYTEGGLFTVVLRVTDNDGAASSKSVELDINTAPIAGGNANPTLGDAPLTVSFDAEGSYDPDGFVVKFEWDFGNGVFYDLTVAGGFVEYTYPESGEWDATLRITDEDGGVDTATIGITVLQSQPTWVHTWGGSGSEEGERMVVDEYGNAYIAGKTTSSGAGGSDVLVMKYSSGGSLLWCRTWGGSNDDWADGIALAPDGSVIVAGTTASYGAGGPDGLVLKFAEGGKLDWARTWGDSDEDIINALTVDAEGNIYFGGERGSYGIAADDALLVKLSPDGNTVYWAKTWNWQYGDRIYGLTSDEYGNVYATGITGGTYGGYEGIPILKYSPAGELQWAKKWGTTTYNRGYGMCVSPSGDVYVAGMTEHHSDHWHDSLLLKMHSNGDFDWVRTWGGDIGDGATDVSVDADGVAIASGATECFGAGLSDLTLVSVKPDGTLDLAGLWGGALGESATALSCFNNGKLYVAGIAPNVYGGWDNLPVELYDPELRDPDLHLDDLPLATQDVTRPPQDAPVECGSPSGTKDSGGGGYDVLAMKIIPDDVLNRVPIAVANATPQSGDAPLAVNFNATGSYDPDGDIEKWEWDCGNGIFVDYTSAEGYAEYTYTQPGSFTARLRVTDNDGAPRTDSVSIEVIGQLQDEVAYWRLDETSGSTVYDNSGYDHDGTLVGSASWASGGIDGNCLNLTGGYASIPYRETMHIQPEMTMEAWVNLPSTAYEQHIVSKKSDAAGGYDLIWYDGMYGSRGVQFRIRLNDGLHYLVDPTELQTGRWYYLVGTYDGDYVRLYRDGKLIAGQYAPGLTIPYLDREVTIGIESYTHRFPLNGHVDEVRLLRRALSPSEVETRYEAFTQGD